MSEPKNTLEMIHCWFDVVIDVIWFWHTHMAGYLLLVLVASLQDWKLTVPICWEAKLSVFRIPIWCSKSLKEIHTGIGIGGSGREGCVTFSLSISLKPAILPWVFRPSYSIEPVSWPNGHNEVHQGFCQCTFGRWSAGATSMPWWGKIRCMNESESITRIQGCKKPLGTLWLYCMSKWGLVVWGLLHPLASFWFANRLRYSFKDGLFTAATDDPKWQVAHRVLISPFSVRGLEKPRSQSSGKVQIEEGSCVIVFVSLLFDPTASRQHTPSEAHYYQPVERNITELVQIWQRSLQYLFFADSDD